MRLGRTCGNNPNFISEGQLPPAAFKASLGFISEFSWTSENSLPKDPAVWRVIAIIPAMGPIPKAQTNNMAKIISVTPQKKSKVLLVIKYINELGAVFFADKKLNKRAIEEPIIVARSAILNVSKSSFKYFGKLKYQ